MRARASRNASSSSLPPRGKRPGAVRRLARIEHDRWQCQPQRALNHLEITVPLIQVKSPSTAWGPIARSCAASHSGASSSPRRDSVLSPLREVIRKPPPRVVIREVVPILVPGHESNACTDVQSFRSVRK